MKKIFFVIMLVAAAANASICECTFNFSSNSTVGVITDHQTAQGSCPSVQEDRLLRCEAAYADVGTVTSPGKIYCYNRVTNEEVVSALYFYSSLNFDSATCTLKHTDF